MIPKQWAISLLPIMLVLTTVASAWWIQQRPTGQAQQEPPSSTARAAGVTNPNTLLPAIATDTRRRVSAVERPLGAEPCSRVPDCDNEEMLRHVPDIDAVIHALEEPSSSEKNKVVFTADLGTTLFGCKWRKGDG